MPTEHPDHRKPQAQGQVQTGEPAGAEHPQAEQGAPLEAREGAAEGQHPRAEQEVS